MFSQLKIMPNHYLKVNQGKQFQHYANLLKELSFSKNIY